MEVQQLVEDASIAGSGFTHSATHWPPSLYLLKPLALAASRPSTVLSGDL